MTNNSKKSNIEDLREVEIIKLVSCSWMFSVPVNGYPDYKVSQEVNEALNQFVKSLGCILKECGSGTGPRHKPILAFTVKIENDVEENVKKIEQYITLNVLPIV